MHYENEEVQKGFNISETLILLGSMESEESKLGVILGVWKPLSPSKICDYPLAVMDAQTFKSEDQAAQRFALNFGIFTANIFGARIIHNPRQKWYYYPFQSTKEVLIFHQYSKGKLFANPHTSFFNKNCPQDTEERVSVEMRVALFF